MTSQQRSAPERRVERRAYPRIRAAAVPYLQARIAGGPQVRLIDLSKRGVQIATSMHMRPGRTVVIRFLSGDASSTLTSAVIRSSVAVLEASGEVTYHTALAFTDELTVCSSEFDEPEAASPADDAGQASNGDDYTMIVMDGRLGAPFDVDEAR